MAKSTYDREYEKERARQQARADHRAKMNAEAEEAFKKYKDDLAYTFYTGIDPNKEKTNGIFDKAAEFIVDSVFKVVNRVRLSKDIKDAVEKKDVTKK